LNQDLQSLPWSIVDIFDDINDCWFAWKSLFNSVVDEHCPLKTFRPRKKPCPWFSNEIESLKLIRDQWHNRAILSNSQEAWAKWKKCKNKVTSLCRQAKVDYFKKTIEEGNGNSKLIWRTLRTLIPKCKSNGIQALDINGEVVTDFNEIANHFNTFFVTIGEKLASVIPRVSRSAMDYLQAFIQPPATKFNLKCVHTAEVLKLLLDLSENKATGLDNYQAKLLKLTANSIAPSITNIFNKSLITGKFPTEWKQAKISAIFKKGSKVDSGNYRPISILPVISKLIEKIVHQQLYTYLSTNNLLSQAQSGFRKSFSTQTSLHRLIEEIYEALNSARVVGLVAIDLKKAFDTVDHQILLSKLKFYGIEGVPLQWFKDYLLNRSQITSLNGTLSRKEFIKTGVPQGSILGPLLFILYVNDLPGCLMSSKVNMYADDTAFYAMDKDITNVRRALNEDLKNLHNWLCANKLSLHTGKTKSILICNHQKLRHITDPTLSTTLDSTPIEQVDHLPYLGIELDSRCSFEEHVRGLTSKLNRALGILKRTAPYLPLTTRKMLYNSLVLPHYDYCATVWSCTSQHCITRLQRIQNRAMRIILNAPPRSHIEDLLDTLKWMSVRQRFLYNQMCLMWRIVHGHAPQYLTEHLVLAQDRHEHGTTSAANGNIYIGHGHRFSLFQCGARNWNQLPTPIRQSSTLNGFKRLLTGHLLRNCPKF